MRISPRKHDEYGDLYGDLCSVLPETPRPIWTAPDGFYIDRSTMHFQAVKHGKCVGEASMVEAQRHPALFEYWLQELGIDFEDFCWQHRIHCEKGTAIQEAFQQGLITEQDYRDYLQCQEIKKPRAFSL